MINILNLKTEQGLSQILYLRHLFIKLTLFKTNLVNEQGGELQGGEVPDPHTAAQAVAARG